MMTKTMLLASSAAALVLGAAPARAADAPAPAPADAPAADDAGDGLTEIIVTAQKRSENLQNTPIAASVLSGDQLKTREVVSLVDLGDGAIPSLKVAPFFSRPGALIVNIRGVGVLSDSNQPARDQGVGVYFDGVYFGRPQGLGTALFDVASIEVLKGPQGTNFGRNTEGGAVSITTKKPTGEFGLDLTAGVGNYGAYKGVFHLDLPAVGNLSFKIDGVVSRRGPFQLNPQQGQEGYNSYDKRGLAVTWLWKPSDRFSANYAFDVSYDATSTLYLQQLTAGQGLPTQAVCPGTPPAASCPVLANTRAAIFTLQPNRARVGVVGTPQQPSVGNAVGNRLTLEWNATDDLVLKSITAYRALVQTQFDNGSAATTLQQATASATVVPSFLNFPFARYSLARFRQNQFSEEVQLVGDFDRLKFFAGALYYQERVEDNAQAYNTLQFLDAAGSTFGFCVNTLTAPISSCRTLIQRASYVKTTSIGVFGQATYTLPIANDIFHLTAGGRWTRDEKDGVLFTVNGAAPIVPVNGVNVQAPVPFNRAWSRFDPMVNLLIDVTKDIHLYGKYSTGYRSGGANSRSLAYRSFDPETVEMFEIGLKTEFFDRRARLNLAAYVGNYKDIQLDFSGLYEDVVNGVRVFTTRTTTDTVNAPGTGKLRGIEADLTVAPARGLTLSASYAYNYVRIPATVNPFPQTGGVFITVPIPIYQVYTPENSASGAIDYETPISGNGTRLTFHIDANYDSGYYANYTDSNYDSVTRAVRFAQPKGDSAFLVNARVAIADIPLQDNGARLTISAWSRNLFNEEHVFYKSGTAQAGLSGFFNDPRTFGVDFNIKM